MFLPVAPERKKEEGGAHFGVRTDSSENCVQLIIIHEGVVKNN